MIVCGFIILFLILLGDGCQMSVDFILREHSATNVIKL